MEALQTKGVLQQTLDAHFTERYGVGLTAVEFQLFELTEAIGADTHGERFHALVAHAVTVARTLAPAPLAVGLACRDPIESWVEFLAREIGGWPDSLTHDRIEDVPTSPDESLEAVLAWLLRIARFGETDHGRLPSIHRAEPATASHRSPTL